MGKLEINCEDFIFNIEFQENFLINCYKDRI
jgi:hypothetical protein